MTRFTVVWTQSALDELTAVWMASATRNAVTWAVSEIDHELANDPASKGAELSEGLRVLEMPPLRVLYSVREADRIVDLEKVIQIMD